jgi:hypothetical protein
VVAISSIAWLGLATPTLGAEQRAQASPNVIQVSYSETDGEPGPDRQLMAFSRHTTSLKFATSFHGTRVAAPGRYVDSITDTDLHGRQARHPWIPDRKHGGRGVMRLIGRSLDRRGFANVRVRAKNGDLLDSVRVRIDLSECSSDPPLYPVDCEIRT